MAQFDRNGFSKVESSHRRECAYIKPSYLVRSGPLATWLEDPEAAKVSGALPLAPPSQPRTA